MPESVQFGLRVYFDGDCRFCRRSARILQSLVLPVQTPVMPGQIDPEIFRLMVEHNSWVVLTGDNQSHLKADAFAVVLEQSPFFFWRWSAIPLRWPPVMAVADVIYRWIARNRSRITCA